MPTAKFAVMSKNKVFKNNSLENNNNVTYGEIYDKTGETYENGVKIDDKTGEIGAKKKAGRKTLYDLDLVNKTASYLHYHRSNRYDHPSYQRLADHLGIGKRTLQRYMVDEKGKPEFCRLFRSADSQLKEQRIVEAKLLISKGKLADPALAYCLGHQTAEEESKTFRSRFSLADLVAEAPPPPLHERYQAEAQKEKEPVNEYAPGELERRVRSDSRYKIFTFSRDRRVSGLWGAVYIPTLKRF